MAELKQPPPHNPILFSYSLSQMRYLDLCILQMLDMHLSILLKDFLFVSVTIDQFERFGDHFVKDDISILQDDI